MRSTSFTHTHQPTINLNPQSKDLLCVVFFCSWLSSFCYLLSILLLLGRLSSSSSNKFLKTSIDVLLKLFVQHNRTRIVLTDKTLEAVLMSNELGDRHLRTTRAIDLKRILALLSKKRIVTVQRPVARVNSKLSLLHPSWASTLDTVLQARCICKNNSRARISLSLKHCLEGLLLISIQTNGSNIDGAHVHEDLTKILLLGTLAGSLKLVNTTHRSALRLLTTSVAVDLSIKNDDVHLLVSIKDVVKATKVDIARPAITTNAPERSLCKKIAKVIEGLNNGVLLLGSLQKRNNVTTGNFASLGVLENIDPLLKLSGKLTSDLVVSDGLLDVLKIALTTDTTSASNTKAKLGSILEERVSRSRTATLRISAVWVAAKSKGVGNIATRSTGSDHTITEELSKKLDVRSLTTATASTAELEERLTELRATSIVSGINGITSRHLVEAVLPVGSLLRSNLFKRTHGDALCRADSRANTAANTIQRADLDVEEQSLLATFTVGSLCGDLARSSLNLLLSHQEGTDDSVRASKRAHVALHALSGIPSGHLNGNTTLLCTSSGGRSTASRNKLGKLGSRDTITSEASKLRLDVTFELLVDLRVIVMNCISVSRVVVRSLEPLLLRIVDLVELRKSTVDTGDVLLDDSLTLLGILLVCAFLEHGDSFLDREHTTELEESSEQNKVVMLTETSSTADLHSIDGVELELLFSNATTPGSRKLLSKLGRIITPRAVEQKDGTLTARVEDGVLANVRGMVASSEVGVGDRIGALDGGRAKAHVSDGDTTGLVSSEVELTLSVNGLLLCAVAGSKLECHLSSTHSTIAAKTPKSALSEARSSNLRAAWKQRQAKVRDIILNTNDEALHRLGALEVSKDGTNHERSESLIGEAITTANDHSLVDGLIIGTLDCGHHIKEERLTNGTRLLGTVEHGNTADGLGQDAQEVLCAPWAEEVDTQDTNLSLLLTDEIVDDLLHSEGTSAHSDDDVLSVGSTGVVEEVITTASHGEDLVHSLLDSLGGTVLVIISDGLEHLHPVVTSGDGTTLMGVSGLKSSLAELLEVLVVVQGAELVIRDVVAGGDRVRRLEAVEEVHERHGHLESRSVSHGSEIHGLLDGARAKLAKTAHTDAHDITVIAVDGGTRATDLTSGDVEDARDALTAELVEGGNHKKKSLGASKGRCKTTCSTTTVESSTRTTL